MSVNCVGYSTLTVSSSAVGIDTDCSPVMPSRAQGGIVHIEDEQVRYRSDGTNPTATEGVLKNAGGEIVFDSWTCPGNNWRTVMKALKLIRVVNDSKLKIEWFD